MFPPQALPDRHGDFGRLASGEGGLAAHRGATDPPQPPPEDVPAAAEAAPAAAQAAPAAAACADSAEFCAQWAGAGECTRNVAYMASACAASCGLCS